MTTLKVGSIRYMIESTANNVDSSENHALLTFYKELKRTLKNCNIAVAQFDESEVRQGGFTIEHLGTPFSPEARKTMELEFGMDDDEVASA